ncbi:MAG TPA: DUF4382 domain-containing protein [Candidatus Acidoferrum sp.]|nr:DUF4382 domain-containing protein [Candidatus Acidoferrum sp.]
MKSYYSRMVLGAASAALMFFSMGCSSGSSSSGSDPTLPPVPQNGTVSLIVSDAPTEDWATIGVKVLSIALTPQGGGSDVTVYTAPSPAPTINLLQLDQLNEILGNVYVPVGTYTAATITVSGNSGDVLLTVSAGPETGFAAAAGSTIPSSQIQVVGAKGNAGALSVPVKLTLDSPLVVTSTQSNALDLEFDLSHPAFIVAHVPPSGGGMTMWAVNFNGTLRHRPIHDIRRLILRHHYGTVTAVSADNTTLTFNKDYPVYPPTNPETAVTTTQPLSVLADNANGTLYYDLDAKTHATITDFSTIASSIVGKYIRVAARYQVDGTLVAVRLWASTSFNSVWISPEGHVLHVDTNSNTIVVDNELGVGVPLTVDANTLFFFRTPADAQSDATAIGQGPAFLSNLVRGFKVHASVVDPLASQFVASSIDIEIARYDGTISGSSLTSFSYTHNFRNANDDYTVQLPFISSSTPNGNDPQSGNPITGFKWWNFTYPTIVDSGTNAIADFDNATNGSVNFGGSVGLMQAAGETYAKWNDPNAQNGWAAPSAVLLPTTIPWGVAATSYSNGSFTVTVAGGTQAVPVNLNTTSGSATLVYQVDWTNGVLSVSPVDITTTAGQNTLASNLVTATPVKVYGIPQANGTIKCYVLTYFTGFAQATTN